MQLRHRTGKVRRQVFRRIGVLCGGLLLSLIGTQVRLTKVEGDSMAPTLRSGDRLLIVNRAVTTAWDWLSGNQHSRRVVVIIEDPGRPLVKRVVAFPGDRVHTEVGRLFVNGAQVDEPYAHYSSVPIPRVGTPNRAINSKQHSTVVPPRHIYVLGDNRGLSLDSRQWGPIRMDSIVGSAVAVFR